MNRPSVGSWSAIIPLKPPGQRKTRLAGRLSPAQRDRLAEDMFHHVASILRAAPSIAEITMLSESPLQGWAARWSHDHGRGLNAELPDAARSCRTENLLVIHADLPFLTAADILDLTATDQTRSSIAPDRHGTGTNALALREDFPIFAFGDRSLASHLALAQSPLRVVQRIGLALDIDTPDDLDLACAHAGFSPSWL